MPTRPLLALCVLLAGCESYASALGRHHGETFGAIMTCDGSRPSEWCDDVRTTLELGDGSYSVREAEYTRELRVACIEAAVEQCGGVGR